MASAGLQRRHIRIGVASTAEEADRQERSARLEEWDRQAITQAVRLQELPVDRIFVPFFRAENAPGPKDLLAPGLVQHSDISVRLRRGVLRLDTLPVLWVITDRTEKVGAFYRMVGCQDRHAGMPYEVAQCFERGRPQRRLQGRFVKQIHNRFDPVVDRSHHALSVTTSAKHSEIILSPEQVTEGHRGSGDTCRAGQPEALAWLCRRHVGCAVCRPQFSVKDGEPYEVRKHTKGVSIYQCCRVHLPKCGGTRS